MERVELADGTADAAAVREHAAQTAALEHAADAAAQTGHVWYVCYGSNMSLRRLNYYLAGGQPPSGALTYPGCRDKRQPERSLPVTLPGRVYFALEALAWTGGMAFYDAEDPGETPARAHLLTRSQFSDIMAQEMCFEPGSDLDLTEVLTHGRVVLGPGHYQALLYLGDLEGCPSFTFTAPWRRSEVELRSPSATYLRHLAAGLSETYGWSPQRIADYLSSRPGAAGHWSPGELVAVIDELPGVAADRNVTRYGESARESTPATVGAGIG
ncbi:hypothetical protein BDK92_2898 [Micromonospora pisi]|uniref:Histone deacetylase n=1 Tax=Micromonospora pisi TaxID=589240 RepID=A0A495JHP0_9ACTN|nr:histone deacetylase [Micromonospora pisi]RKR88570.1 hypothetical protein BDK92_2898 [Micromonospora pisi]